MGASQRRVRRLILMEGARLAAFGVLFGLPPGLGLLYFLSLEYSDLPRWTHLPAAILTAILVTGVALLASWLPARRAATVDPVTVLRVE
jgi:ABC-type lipoprotein release transport system permease subunit